MSFSASDYTLFVVRLDTAEADLSLLLRLLHLALSFLSLRSTDFEKTFVCGEIMNYNDLKELGSESAVKAVRFPRLFPLPVLPLTPSDFWRPLGRQAAAEGQRIRNLRR